MTVAQDTGTLVTRLADGSRLRSPYIPRSTLASSLKAVNIEVKKDVVDCQITKGLATRSKDAIRGSWHRY